MDPKSCWRPTSGSGTDSNRRGVLSGGWVGKVRGGLQPIASCVRKADRTSPAHSLPPAELKAYAARSKPQPNPRRGLTSMLPPLARCARPTPRVVREGSRRSPGTARPPTLHARMSRGELESQCRPSAAPSERASRAENLQPSLSFSMARDAEGVPLD